MLTFTEIQDAEHLYNEYERRLVQVTSQMSGMSCLLDSLAQEKQVLNEERDKLIQWLSESLEAD